MITKELGKTISNIVFKAFYYLNDIGLNSIYFPLLNSET